MTDDTQYDLIIKNVRVVRPGAEKLHDSDIAVKDGMIVGVGPELDIGAAAEVYDGQGRLAFPGVVDAHMHTGIYSPLQEDAVSESRAAAMGGVTSSLNYMRTGGYYLNKGGPTVIFSPRCWHYLKDASMWTTATTWRPWTISTLKRYRS